MAARVAGLPIPGPLAAVRAVRLEVIRTPRPLQAWFALLGVLMFVGAIAAVRALIPGDKGVATTPTFEWGLLIVGYVFFAVTTSGLCLTSSLGTVFGIDRFRPLEKRHAVLALLSLVTAFGIIALDLHYPVRLVFGAMFSPSPSSPMWWMGVFYGVYLVFLLTEVWSIFWRHQRIHAWACVLASGMAVVAPTTLGAVFGVIAARSIWAGVFTPLLMLATGLLSGTAVLGLVFSLVARLQLTGFERVGRLALGAVRTVLSLGLAVVALLVARQLIVGASSSDPGLAAATQALIHGPLATAFVGVRVIGGLLLPAVLLMLPWARRPAHMLAASVLVLVGVFADRLTFVAAGQIAPTTAISGVVSTPYALYVPSPVEIGILVGALAFVAFAYTLAERYLDLRESEVHVGLWMWLPQLRRLALAGESTALAVAEPIGRAVAIAPEPVEPEAEPDLPVAAEEVPPTLGEAPETETVTALIADATAMLNAIPQPPVATETAQSEQAAAIKVATEPEVLIEPEVEAPPEGETEPEPPPEALPEVEAPPEGPTGPEASLEPPIEPQQSVEATEPT